MNRTLTRAAEATVLAVLATLILSIATPAAADEGAAPAASGWDVVKFPQGQPLCTGVGLRGSLYFDRLDCGFATVAVSETTPDSAVTIELVGEDGAVFETQTATYRTDDATWEFEVLPDATWPSGIVTARAVVDGVAAPGSGQLFLNQLGATVAAAEVAGGYAPGDPIELQGAIYEQDTVALDTQKTNVPATFSVEVVTPAGERRGPYGPFTASSDGAIAATLPGEATAGLTADASSGFRLTVGVDVVDASHTNLLTGEWRATRAGTGSVPLTVAPTTLVLENSFVSAVGWVKPGDTYPFRVFVRNFTGTAADGATVTIPAVDGMSFVQATPTSGSGTATVTPTEVTWSAGTVPAATDAGPGTRTLVVEARADTLAQDAEVVWKNLSTTATLAYTGGPAGLASTSLGPKVIPPGETYDTARYGYRPFPVVPVDYFDRKHEDAHTGERLAEVINSPDVAGSTYNLFQEMSFGQLHPNGAVPSAGIATADFGGVDPAGFSSLQPQGTCHGLTHKDSAGTALYPERIRNGWYQLPGDTDYYGDDKFGTAVVGSVAGVGALMDIDSACGPTGKAVYDAALIADPEIDYSDFDTDKDGVVDFFMLVFAGAGGNGVSQTSVPPYDNIWPHSSSLEFYYTDANGEKGYVSDDQLKNLEGEPLFWTDGSRSQMTTADTGIPVFVRVGPYNVNPEASIDKASVISHEYGHSLGLPDFYSLGSRETYGSWNLMASDHSQHMDVFGKQELGWVVPRVLGPGTTDVTGMRDGKLDTHRIDWVRPDGTPYTLTGPSVHNGEAYVAKLPSRQVIDPALVPSGDRVWWSTSGNDYGCPPQGGRNLDVYLPELEQVAPGTPVTVTFKSLWDIEWDYDYGFVMVSDDGGETYRSLPSAKGYTTPAAQNPNANGCQAQYGNGLTGSNGSYQAGTQDVDRVLGNYPDPAFVEDEYDLSSAAGKQTVLRFSYATDPGLARPGWFVDDLVVKVGDTVVYESDFEDDGDLRLFPGGCAAHGKVAASCTSGWQHVSAGAGSPADHAYYLELRDRSGFDLDGKGQSDRGIPTFVPGLYLMYTDEAHGYGNVGTDDPPAQTPLDAAPQPGNDTPNLDDAAWNVGDPRFSDAGEGHVDNYTDPSRADGLWRLDFGCLTFDVLAMSGDTEGPATVPGDLTADVRFTTGAGCGAFDHGHGDAGEEPANAAPTAVAQAKPTTAKAGQKVRFDGSGSSDDRQAPSELAYAWDLDGNGTFEASGSSVTHAYAAAGVYEAVLRVTDGDGATGTDTIRITIEAQPGNGGGGGGSAPPSGSGGPPPTTTTTAAPAPTQPPAGGVAGAQVTQKRFVRGTGVVRRPVRGLSKRAAAVVPRARFAVNLAKGPRGKVVYLDRRAGHRFHTLGRPTVRYGRKVATLRGRGLHNGRRVTYVAVLTDNGAGRRDVFALRLSDGFRVSSRLIYGNVVVR